MRLKPYIVRHLFTHWVSVSQVSLVHTDMARPVFNGCVMSGCLSLQPHTPQTAKLGTQWNWVKSTNLIKVSLCFLGKTRTRISEMMCVKVQRSGWKLCCSRWTWHTGMWSQRSRSSVQTVLAHCHTKRTSSSKCLTLLWKTWKAVRL